MKWWQSTPVSRMPFKLEVADVKVRSIPLFVLESDKGEVSNVNGVETDTSARLPKYMKGHWRASAKLRYPFGKRHETKFNTFRPFSLVISRGVLYSSRPSKSL